MLTNAFNLRPFFNTNERVLEASFRGENMLIIIKIL